MPDEPNIVSPAIPPGGVFISHVHEDRSIADAFSVLIQDVTAGSVPTYSSSATSGDQGIKYGTEWFQWIRARVDAADHVVAILTPNSVGRPWILFEAGLGKAAASGSVFGLAVGMSVAAASVGPFAVFQNSSSEKLALMKLCRQLIEPSGLHPRDEVVAGMVDAFLTKVQSSTADEAPNIEDPKSSAIFQALEDLKFLVRDRPPEPRSARRQRDDRELQPILEVFEMEPRVFGMSRTRILGDIADALSFSSIAIVLRSIPTAVNTRRSLNREWFYILDRMIHDARPSSRTEEIFLNLVRREFHTLLEEQERLAERRAALAADRAAAAEESSGDDE